MQTHELARAVTLLFERKTFLGTLHACYSVEVL